MSVCLPFDKSLTTSYISRGHGCGSTDTVIAGKARREGLRASNSLAKGGLAIEGNY